MWYLCVCSVTLRMSARPRAGSQGSLEEPDDEVMPYSDDETDEELQSEDDLDRAEDQLPEPEPRPAPAPGEMKSDLHAGKLSCQSLFCVLI